MSKVTLALGLGTLLFFGLGGILIIEFIQKQDFVNVLCRGWHIPIQILVGISTGLITSGVALFIISRRFFEQEKKYYYTLISKLDLSLYGMVFLSLAAGISEEIFFRAGIQPFLGVWWTAILFVLLHGYLNPQNRKISIYGLAMVIIIAGFGYLFKFIGLFSAMTAHAVFDLVLFLDINKRSK